MDPLQAKAASDAFRQYPMSEDAFYQAHGCEWFLAIRVFLGKLLYRRDSPNARQTHNAPDQTLT